MCLENAYRTIYGPKQRPHQGFKNIFVGRWFLTLLFSEYVCFWNSQKWLSRALESFISVTRCSKLYQMFAWTPRNIFCMHNVFQKFIQNDFRVKKETSSRFQRLFVGISCQQLQGMVFLKSTNMALSYRKIACTCRSILYYLVSYLKSFRTL